jgi:beta-lactam-binding protein with PASTA domain
MQILASAGFSHVYVVASATKDPTQPGVVVDQRPAKNTTVNLTDAITVFVGS